MRKETIPSENTDGIEKIIERRDVTASGIKHGEIVIWTLPDGRKREVGYRLNDREDGTGGKKIEKIWEHIIEAEFETPDGPARLISYLKENGGSKEERFARTEKMISGEWVSDEDERPYSAAPQ